MRHLWSLSPASLVLLVRHGGKFAQSGKAPTHFWCPPLRLLRLQKLRQWGFAGRCGPQAVGWPTDDVTRLLTLRWTRRWTGGMVGRMRVLENTELLRHATLST